MYRIVVLAESSEYGTRLVGQTKKICAEHGLFPSIEHYSDQEKFFTGVRELKKENVIVALPGVAGLNAIEHLKSLCPECRLIWFSDLDFSLQAYRIRADYFMLNPVTEDEVREGIAVWMNGRK